MTMSIVVLSNCSALVKTRHLLVMILKVHSMKCGAWLSLELNTLLWEPSLRVLVQQVENKRKGLIKLSLASKSNQYYCRCRLWWQHTVRTTVLVVEVMGSWSRWLLHAHVLTIDNTGNYWGACCHLQPNQKNRRSFIINIQQYLTLLRVKKQSIYCMLKLLVHLS